MAKEKERPNTRPTTSSLAWAEWRRGLLDSQNAVLNPWNGITQTHETAGTIGSPTQAEVTAEKGTVYGFQNILNDYAVRGGVDREAKEKGMDR